VGVGGLLDVDLEVWNILDVGCFVCLWGVGWSRCLLCGVVFV